MARTTDVTGPSAATPTARQTTPIKTRATDEAIAKFERIVADALAVVQEL
jgi:hypothetical protein